MARHGLAHGLLEREQGERRQAWMQRIRSRRCAGLELARSRNLSEVHVGGVTWLELDTTEHRYLLTGGADGSVAVYDTQALGTRWAQPELQPLCLRTRGHRGTHQFTVSGVTWYPVDTGLFVTASYDQDVKVWDTNELEVVCTFALPAKATCVAMSRCKGSAHALVAAACLDPNLRLCDPASGAFTHTLVGHKHPIWSVAWSLRSEHEVVSGDAYGQVRVWDIRRFGALHVLDQYHTESARSVRAAPYVTAHAVAANSSRAGGSVAANGGSSLGRITEGGQGRAVSAPAGLEDAVDAAWKVLDEEIQAGRLPRSTSTQPASLPRPPKRAKAAHDAVDGAGAAAGAGAGSSYGQDLEEGEILVSHSSGHRGRGRSHLLSARPHNKSPEPGHQRAGPGAAARVRKALGLAPSLVSLAPGAPARHRAGTSRAPAAAGAGSGADGSDASEARSLLARLPGRALGASAPLALQPARAAAGAIGGGAPRIVPDWDVEPELLPQQGAHAAASAHHHSTNTTFASAGSEGGSFSAPSHPIGSSNHGIRALGSRGGGLSLDAARAHQDAITCVMSSPDGLHWFTAGTDSRLRLWSTEKGGWWNMLVGYADTHNRAQRGRRLGVSEDGRTVFHPSGNVVQVFDALSGRLLAQLGGQSGHRDAVNAVDYNPATGEVYSAGSDGRVLVWEPRREE
uniref:DNA excision repair protein ERCC-8 n=1 Tax=Chlamydomonas leiostraca TaxID=1034604 RepID=A0A7S0WP23_9CHLO|mmetsp:Transcript_2140/g.5435  ORF Transcript_2140/g.5435 Transcript_2140/m.5435 type:complete len:683 (+) Transcript_2140:46-2094(+)